MTPEHLQRFSWYAAHQAWLKANGISPRYEPAGDVEPARANLSRAVLSGANLRFADLSRADLSGADLSEAVLRFAVLSRADLSGADLSEADLSEADLSGAVLSGADLSEADLNGANLNGAYLSGADLNGAVLPEEIPIVSDLDRKILEQIESGAGRLEMSDWHTCETTHCRAGWAIVLAGKPGHQLEEKIGPCAAGALIYAASRHGEPVPDFFASNNEVLDDLRKAVQA